MPKHLLVTLLLSLALLALACNGNGAPPSPNPTAEDTGGAPAVTPDTTPAESSLTPTAEAPTVEGASTPTPLPTPDGTPAVAPADLSQFEGQMIDEKDCIFDPITTTIDCGPLGTYAANPIPAGEDISCSLLSLEGEPTALRCSIQDPFQTIYYAIQ